MRRLLRTHVVNGSTKKKGNKNTIIKNNNKSSQAYANSNTCKNHHRQNVA